MSDKPYLKFNATEQVLIEAAATLYAGYLASGRVPEGQEIEWLGTAAEHAIKLGQSIGTSVVAEDELG